MSNKETPTLYLLNEDFSIEIADKLPRRYKKLIENIEAEVIGQKRAIRRLVRRAIIVDSGMQDTERPPSPVLFAGPPAVGKTLTAKVFSKHWIGGPPIIISGENFQQAHEGSVLKGSPPGYVGYENPSPLEEVGKFEKEQRVKELLEAVEEWKKKVSVRQKISRLDQTSYASWQTFINVKLKKYIKRYVGSGPFKAVVLIDEVEKMHPDILKQFLGILQEGIYTLHSGRKIDFRKTLFIFTSNIGTKKITDILENKATVGFGNPKKQQERGNIDQEIYQNVKKEIMKYLPEELYSRIGSDGIVVFHSLSKKELALIIQKEIEKLQYILSGRVKNSTTLIIRTSDEFDEFILKEANSKREGARQIGRLIDKHMKEKLAFGFGSEELKNGDCVLFDVVHSVNEDTKVVLTRLARPSSIRWPALGSTHSTPTNEIADKIFKDLEEYLNKLVPKAVPPALPDKKSPDSPKEPDTPSPKKSDTSDTSADGKPPDKNDSPNNT